MLTVDGVHPCDPADYHRRHTAAVGTGPTAVATSLLRCPAYTHGNLMLAESIAQGVLQLASNA